MVFEPLKRNLRGFSFSLFLRSVSLSFLHLPTNMSPSPRIILDEKQLDIIIHRLCRQLIETHDQFKNSVVIGLQPRGVFLARRIHHRLSEITGNIKIPYGDLDVTFYRDDFRKKDLVPNKTSIDFIIEDRNVVLIDDVLFTGRTIRAGLDAMMAFGRPADVELLVLIDRRYSRNLPIQAKYIGCTIDSVASEKVKVDWKETEGEDKVWLLTNEENKAGIS
jgi:pyrimidine operon attenuation protein/uracil phosphoribosyltransferase